MTPQLWALVVLLALIILTVIYRMCRVSGAITDEERRAEHIERYLDFKGIRYVVISPEDSDSGLWETRARVNEYVVRHGVGETRLEALENLMRVLTLAEVRA